MGALTPYRETTAMPKPPVAAQIHQPLYVHRHFTPQIAFNHIVVINQLTDLNNFLFRKFIDPAFKGNRRFLANLLRKGPANTMNIRQRYFHTLVRRDIYTCNSGQSRISGKTLRVTVVKS
jgi:hypothetical protein